MIKRCYSQKSKDYINYGARGISVCDSWRHSFKQFYLDMGKRPHGMTIDRIDNNGNYEPSNCKWSTCLEQSLNKRVYKNNKTGYSGITIYGDKYRVRFRKKHYGFFYNIEDAISARLKAQQA